MTYKKLSVLFVGLVYILMAVLILLRPGFFYYWVASVFFIQGLVSLSRAFIKPEDKKD
ncbi:MAG: hypothetical protein ACQESB_01275 [Elusimicrobiota bacterium]